MRRLLTVSTAVVLALAFTTSTSRAIGQTPLAPTDIPQFAQPLPLLDLDASGDGIQVVSGTQPLTMRMCEFDAAILPPSMGLGPTHVWGYVAGDACPTTERTTYTGPVVVASRGTPTRVTYVNELGTTDTSQVIAYTGSTDQTLHWADPLNDAANECHHMAGVPEGDCAENYSGPIPAVTHLHGGEVPPEVDGGPDAWYTSDGSHQGPGYYSAAGASGNEAIYTYPNSQQAAPAWFHDHTLGATRLNVYAGLAGAWFIVDPDQDLPDNLPGVAETVPLVIQDRQFDTNGQLFFQAGMNGGVQWNPNLEHPYWSPEFVGDVIAVNGKAWPYLNVEARRYRFLFLNGSNARTYEMFLSDPVSKNPGPPIWIISTDGGYLDAPVKIDAAGLSSGPSALTLMPGERYGAIIDFAGYEAGTLGPNHQPYSGQWILKNTAKMPYPGGEAAKGNTIGRVMEFVVSPSISADTTYNPATDGALRLSEPIVRLADPVAGHLTVTPDLTRQLTLNEVMEDGGPLAVLVNNTTWSGSDRDDFTAVSAGGQTIYYSEMPHEGDTELWEIVNLTEDAHPIHLHLTQFQVVNRQRFNTNRYESIYTDAFESDEFEPGMGPPLDYNPSAASGWKFGGNPSIDPYLQGPARPPAAYEAGWKDTVLALPGQVTRVVMRWAPLDLPLTAPDNQRYYPFDPSGREPDGSYHWSFVWHCHIIDHEDNEMMRPDIIQPNPAAPPTNARDFQRGVDY